MKKIIVLFCIIFLSLGSSVSAECTVDVANNTIKLNTSGTNLGKTNVPYGLYKDYSNLPIIEIDQNKWIEVLGVAGNTNFKRYGTNLAPSTLVKSGTIDLDRSDITVNISLNNLGKGVYQFRLPDKEAGYGVSPCGGGSLVSGTVFTIGNSEGEEFDAVQNLQANDGKLLGPIMMPLNDIVEEYSYIAYLDTSLNQICPDGSTCTQTGKIPKGGRVNISSLPPTTKFPSSGGMQYKLLVFFSCQIEDGSKNRLCTFGNKGEITFTKSITTDPISSTVIEAQSNDGLEACRGDLTCANCIARMDDEGTTFKSFQEAATAEKIVYTNNVYTAIGCVDPSQEGLIVRIMQISFGLIGGLIIIRIGQAVIQLQGGKDPEAVKEGMETLWSALFALILLIFALVGVRFLGINLLGVLSPGTIEISE